MFGPTNPQSLPVEKSLEVIGFPDYIVDQRGYIFRKKNRKEIQHQYNNYDHVYVTLYSNGKRKNVGVAKATLIAHQGESDNSRETYILHKDGDTTNVSLSNIMWASKVRSYNHHQRMKSKRGKFEYESRPIEEVTKGLTFDNILQAAAYFVADPFEIENNLLGFHSDFFPKSSYDFRYR